MVIEVLTALLAMRIAARVFDGDSAISEPEPKPEAETKVNESTERERAYPNITVHFFEEGSSKDNEEVEDENGRSYDAQPVSHEDAEESAYGEEGGLNGEEEEEVGFNDEEDGKEDERDH